MNDREVRNDVAPSGNDTAAQNATAPGTGSAGSGHEAALVPDWLAESPLGSAAHWVAELFQGTEHSIIFRLIVTVLILLAVGVVGRVSGRLLERSARRTAHRQKLDEWKTRALISRTRPLNLAIRIFTFLAAVAILLFVWGLQTAFVSMLAAAGFAGIVIGMAAASSLSNLIAGFVIFYNNPFNIGDWVSIEGEEGIVLDVKAGATVIQTWDNEKVTIPNRVVEGAKVKNFSDQRQLRRRFAIGVDYATDITKARAILEETIRGNPLVLSDPEPQVIGVNFGDSSINLEVRYWVAPLRVNALLVQTWFMQEVQRKFAQEGIVIPFPQRTMVYRFENGNAPPGETVSTLAYDPKADDRPFPAPPLQPPVATGTATDKQSTHPADWFDSFTKGWLRSNKKRGEGPDGPGAEQRPQH